MSKSELYDLTYVTIDSLSEGVGSSQILPLISRLNTAGLKINLITLEKSKPDVQRIDYFESIGVEWNFREFGSGGVLAGIGRLNILRREINNTNLIHARSDIPAVSGIASNEAPVLWDVRSLWADQKVLIQKTIINDALYRFYRGLENIAASKSVGMSTLTSAVIPILEQRHKHLPSLRTVVPTAVDLDRFRYSSNFPIQVKALFSGTYNDYYDLELSKLFMVALRKQIDLEIHWARPMESSKIHIGVGEELVIPTSHDEMSTLIPLYSFGVSVCKLNAGPSLMAAMPTKIGEFLSCGRPVVVNKGLGDMDQFIEEFDAGVILDGNLSNLELAASKLVSLLADPETPQRCRALAEKYFNMDDGATKYLDLYSQMLSQNYN